MDIRIDLYIHHGKKYKFKIESLRMQLLRNYTQQRHYPKAFIYDS